MKGINNKNKHEKEIMRKKGEKKRNAFVRLCEKNKVKKKTEGKEYKKSEIGRKRKKARE